MAASFVFWASVTCGGMRRADEAKDRAARLLSQALTSHGAGVRSRMHSFAGDGPFDARASDEARVHAANLFSRRSRASRTRSRAAASWSGSTSLARGPAKACCVCWRQSIGRMVRGSVAGAFTWWQRVAANATAALLAKHRASRALTRVHETLVARFDGWGICVVGTRHARRESSGRFQAFGDATLHAGPRAAGPEILDGSIFVVAQTYDGR